MTQFDQDLLKLQQDTARKKELEAKLKELRSQQRTFDGRIIELRVDHNREQADVDKLEGRSLANYFYQVIGKMDEKLDKERQEAYAARVRLDTAEAELAAVERDIGSVLAQLRDLADCEERYAAELEKKRQAIKTAGTPAGAKLLELEAGIAMLESRKKEIREAVSAGYSAIGAADSVLSELSSAENWNTWDLVGGGGIITHMAKHSHLDEAQSRIQRLQEKLRRFQTELADIRIQANTQVNVDGFLRFADYFFDGLFADWAMGQRISQSQSSVQRTRNQIRAAIQRLDEMASAADREIAAMKTQTEEIVLEE